MFGPKIGAYIDTSILANIIIIIMLTKNSDYRVEIDYRVSRLLYGIGGIVLYSVLISIANAHLDIVFYGRMVRTLCSICGLWVFVTKSGLSKKEIEEVLTNVLLIHAIVVIITATIATNIQDSLRWFTAYDKHIRQYRSTGLMAGFDMAGLLCNMGVILVLIKDKFSIVKYVVFSIAVMLTSRFSVVAYVVITAVYLLFIRNRTQEKIKKVVLLVTLIPIALFGLCVFALTTTNTLFSGNASWFALHFPKIYNLAYSVNDSFARSDGQFVVDQQFQFSDNIFDVIFGRGFYGGGDPGYTRFINAIGVIGLAFVLIWHSGLLRMIMKVNINSSEEAIKRFKLVCFSLIIIGLDFKNTYFFTGTFFEGMLLMILPYLANEKGNISESETLKCVN